jgi:hypothetical protein
VTFHKDQVKHHETLKERFLEMREKDEIVCEETDYLHHMLNEQITRICVKEEEERMKEELEDNDR